MSFKVKGASNEGHEGREKQALAFLNTPGGRIKDEQVLAFLCANPTNVLGAPIGTPAASLPEFLRNSSDGSVGNGEELEEPEYDFDTRSWGDTWPQMATHHVYTCVDELLSEVSYTFATWTPSKEWMQDPPPRNERVAQLRQAIVDRLVAQYGPPRQSPKAVFHCGPVIVSVEPLKESGYEWSLVELEVIFRARAEDDLEKGQISMGTVEELAFIAEAINIPDAHDPYFPVTTVERTVKDGELIFVANFEGPDGEDSACLGWSPSDAIFDAQGVLRLVFVQAFINELGIAFGEYREDH